LFDIVRLVFIAAWLVILPFAAVGLYASRTNWREHALLLVVFLSQAVVSSLYFTGTRFRTPIDGVVGIWAVAGLMALAQRKKTGDGK